MNDFNKKIFILIPAYNEASKIETVIKSIQEKGFKNILVVSDGSCDGTDYIASKAGVEVLRLVLNRGQGAALRVGIEYLKEVYSPDVIVTFDADGQHYAEDIPKVIEPILNEEADIVLGSRFLNSKNYVPLLRRIILKIGVVFTNLISNINLTDTHNGFRALSKKAIACIKITQRKMEHASEIIDEISKNKLYYKEVPVQIIYTDYSMSKGQKSYNFLKMGLKFIFNKIIK